MYIKNFKINNFRGLSEVEFEGLSNINIILGENNCGKTSVLEAIHTALKVWYEMDYMDILNDTRGVSKEDFDFKYLLYKHNYKRPISIKINDDLKIEMKRFFDIDYDNKQLKHTDKGEYRRRRRFGRLDSDNFASFVVKIYDKDKEIKDFIYNSYGAFREGTDYVDNIYVDNVNEHLKYHRSLFLSNNLSIEDERTKGAQYIREKKLEKSLTKILNKIDHKVVGWEFGQRDSILIDIEGEQERRPIGYMGDGFNKVFSILTTLHSCKDGILFIDEIENGLHYKSIDLLITALYEFIKLNPKTQLFITTHNIDFLKSLNKFLQEKERADEVFSLYTMKKRSDDAMRVYKHDKETLENYMYTDSELR